MNVGLKGRIRTWNVGYVGYVAFLKHWGTMVRACARASVCVGARVTRESLNNPTYPTFRFKHPTFILHSSYIEGVYPTYGGVL